HDAAVHLDGTVTDELTGFGARRGEAHAIHDIVQPPLEEAQQVLAGRPLHAGGAMVDVAELPLEHTVHAAQLLLLAKLHAVVRQAPAPGTRRRSRGRLQLALRLERLDAALQEQVRTFAPGELAGGSTISGHDQRYLRL